MRIIDPIVVEFEGVSKVKGEEVFWLVDDHQNRHQVSIPNNPRIIELFRWLSDNDCLRYLIKLEPEFSSNAADIECVHYKNAMKLEHHNLMSLYKNGKPDFDIIGMEDVPEFAWKVRWSFWSKDHAVMFKLAMAGPEDDSL